jgi:hypothetical protein
MAYKATHDVVQRVRPLLERLATRTIDKARLLQYLSAMAGVDWGALSVRERSVIVEEGREIEVLSIEDLATGQCHELQYPQCLPRELDAAVREEYKRLALDRRLTVMNPTLFDHFYGASHCARCRWSGPEHAQIHLECRFAGWPVNFEARDPA